MKPHLIAFACLFAFTACKTVQEAATDEAMIVCTQGGYGPGNQYHAYCMENLTALAVQLEQQRRAEQFALGAAQIAAALDKQPAPAAAAPAQSRTMPAPGTLQEHRPTVCMRSVIGGAVVCN